jgi:hypothetical protein
MKAGDIMTPKGIIPVLSHWLGSFWVGYSLFAGLAGIYWTWESRSQHSAPLELIIQLLPGALAAILTVFTLSVPGLLLAGLFPAIRVTDRGLEYRYLFMWGFVRWHEIETIARVKQPMELVVISRPLAILNGLWFASLHGQLAEVGKPVILLSINWEDRDNLMQTIHQHQAASAVRADLSPAAG